MEIEESTEVTKNAEIIEISRKQQQQQQRKLTTK